MNIKELSGSVVLVLGLTALSGCDRPAPPVTERPTTAGDVLGGLTNAAATTKNYAFETKDRAAESLQKGLADMDAKIDELAAKSANYTGQVKSKADDALARLRAQRNEAGKKLDELKATGQEKWQEAQAGFQEAWQKLKDTYAQVKNDFRD